MGTSLRVLSIQCGNIYEYSIVEAASESEC